MLDNFSTGKIENLKPFLKQIELIKGDFTDLAVARKAVKGIDFVLHHGAVPSVPLSVEDPIGTNNANILGTLNMLVSSRDEKIKRFIYAASSSAYGDSSIMPKVELMAVAPKTPYAIQKLASEEYCQSFYNLYGLETVCLRYFNVFGPNQDPTSVYSAVIPIFIKKILKGESPIIYGDGETSRDFTYIENIVDANIKACKVSKKIAGEVINVATGQEISLNQLTEKINKVLGTSIKPIYKKERLGDIKNSLADIKKAQKLLKYKTIVNFEDGLKKTIDFYKQH